MLSGQTILVVEAEFLIALDIQRMLEELSVGQMLFARTADEAHELVSHWPSLGLAIIEIRPDNHRSTTLVHGLQRAGIPLIISTADSLIRQGHPDFPDVPVVVKPVAESELSAAIRAALSA